MDSQGKAWMLGARLQTIPTGKAKRPAAPGGEAWRLLSLGVDAFQPIGGVKPHNGIPTRKYRKEIIRVGQFVKDDENLSFEVTRETLDNFVAQFARMKKAGVSVPLPMDRHVGQEQERAIRLGKSPQINAGWVEDMFREGDSLFIVAKLIGNDAILAASRNDVSLYAPPRFVDGVGNEYIRPVTHVALVPDPVIPGLGDWIPVAASRRKTFKGSLAMNPLLDLLQKIATALGIQEPITEENADQLVTPQINALIEKCKGAEQNPPPADGTDQAAMGGQGAGGALPDAAGRPVKEQTVTTKFVASRAGEKPSPMLVQTLAENRQLKIDGLLKNGKINANVHKKLTERYVGKDGAAVELALSRNDDGADFNSMIAAFEENDPLIVKGKTGPQVPRTIALNDPNKGSDERNPVADDVERRRKAAGLK